MILFFADLRNFNLVNSRFYPFYKGFCVKKKGINEANVNFNCVYVSIGSCDAWCERDNSIRFCLVLHYLRLKCLYIKVYS